MSLAVAVVKDCWVKVELSPIRWSEASPNELSSLSGGSSHEKEMQQTVEAYIIFLFARTCRHVQDAAYRPGPVSRALKAVI